MGSLTCRCPLIGVSSDASERWGNSDSRKILQANYFFYPVNLYSFVLCKVYRVSIIQHNVAPFLFFCSYKYRKIKTEEEKRGGKEKSYVFVLCCLRSWNSSKRVNSLVYVIVCESALWGSVSSLFHLFLACHSWLSKRICVHFISYDLFASDQHWELCSKLGRPWGLALLFLF